MRFVTIAGLVLLVLQAFSSARAQSVVSTDVRTALCAGCTISLERVARLGGSEASDVLVPYGSLAVASTGDILFGSTQTRGEVYRFSKDGTLAGVVGRTGAGPGELRYVTSIMLGSGDTVMVIDGMSRLMNRFRSDGRFIDRTLLPGGLRTAVPLGGRRLFAGAIVPSRAAIGYPLHLIDTLGIITSFGDSHDIVDSHTTGRMNRFLARGADAKVWVAHQLEYRIESWTMGGRRQSVLTRQLPWFPPSNVILTSPHMERPQPRIGGIHYSDDGLLWVYLHTAPNDWKPAPLVEREGRQAPESEVLDPYLHTVIEVIDPRSNVVIAVLRSSRALFPVEGGYLAVYEEDPHGNPSYSIFRPRLSGRNP